MSLHRMLIAAVAALGLTTVAFAADDVTPASSDTSAQAVAAPTVVADAQSTTTTTQKTETVTVTQDKVNLNTATAKELSKVKGLSAAKAKSIVSYRKKHGEFKSLDDLKQVKGLKRMKTEQLKTVEDQLTLG